MEFASKKGDPIGAEEAALQPYLDYLVPAPNNNKPLILKMLQDPDLVAGYNRISCDDEKTQNTLHLFSYGVLADLESDRSRFLPLSDRHVLQLKRLSILTVLENFLPTTNEVPYTDLQQASQTSDDFQLEQYVAHLISNNVVSGKLSQRKKVFILHAIHRPRDVQDIEAMTRSLLELRGRVMDAKLALLAARSNLAEQEQQHASVKTILQKASEIDSSSTQNDSLSASLDASSRRQKRNRGGGMPSFPAGPFRLGGGGV
jgi:PCI domain